MDWYNSPANPNYGKYDAHRLWKQGIRSGDRTIIQLQYGHSEQEVEAICKWLDVFETIANSKLKNYNPDIGF